MKTKIMMAVGVLISTASYASDSAKEIYSALNVTAILNSTAELTEYLTYVKTVGALKCSMKVHYTQTPEALQTAVYTCELSI